MPTNVRVINHSDNELPQYETVGAAGLDVRSTIQKTLTPGESTLICTGLSVEIPEGYEIQVRPRSGLAYKHGITVLNSPGTIDADYRGRIGVILINHGNESFVIKKGERIGQLVLNKVERIQWEPVLALDYTERGTGGFGSTGK